MKKMMRTAALIFTAAAILLAFLCAGRASPVLTALAISCATFSYHLLMRLAVGFAVNAVMHNRANYRARWFQPLPFEEKLYQRLRLHRWKGRLPTYTPELFDLHRSPEDVIQAMCQAEIVHEIILPFSFLPLLAALPFGAFPVFLITSLLAACVDLCFVMIQRYNRPRLIRLMLRLQARKKPEAHLG